MHALCELDMPGEWFIDRNTNILYYYPQEDDDEIAISTKTFNAFNLNNVSFVNFEGLTFKNIRGTAIYAEKGESAQLARGTSLHYSGNQGTGTCTQQKYYSPGYQAP